MPFQAIPRSAKTGELYAETSTKTENTEVPTDTSDTAFACKAHHRTHEADEVRYDGLHGQTPRSLTRNTQCRPCRFGGAAK
jgi:hypothetical protein